MKVFYRITWLLCSIAFFYALLFISWAIPPIPTPPIQGDPTFLEIAAGGFFDLTHLVIGRWVEEWLGFEWSLLAGATMWGVLAFFGIRALVKNLRRKTVSYGDS